MAVDQRSSARVPSRALARVGWFHRAIYDLRTEGSGRGRDAAAVGLGLFVGCTPFWGLHLLACWMLGWLLHLNRLKLYLAANLANPFVMPAILLAEIQAGALARRGTPHELSLDALTDVSPWTFGGDLLLGSVIVGGVLGLVAAGITYASVGRPSSDPAFARLVREAADRFLTIGLTAWEFARGKLRHDPVYREVVAGGWLPSGGTLVDVGCGQGLMLALLAEAREELAAGRWPEGWPEPPRFDRLLGIELRGRLARRAQRALEPAASVVSGDARHELPPRARVVLCFDVLHLMSAGDQDDLLAHVARLLDPDGMLVVREADAGEGWRFAMVRIGNRLKALAVGRWRQRFHFRSAAGWVALLAQHDFRVDLRPMGQGTPFANVLLRATPRHGPRARTASDRRAGARGGDVGRPGPGR